MTNYLDLIILGLATWRISSIVVNEDGPFDIFFKMRAKMGITALDPVPETFWAGLFGCVYCLSVWVGAILILSAIMDKMVTVYLMLPFALSAIAVILEEKING